MVSVTTGIKILHLKPYNKTNAEWYHCLHFIFKENIHIYSTDMHVIKLYMLPHIYIYMQIYLNTKAERVFMKRSFLFHIKNKSFHNRVIYIRQKWKVLKCMMLK